MPWHTKAVVRRNRTKSTWRVVRKKSLMQRLLDFFFKT